MSLLTDNSRIKNIFTEFTKGDKEIAAKHIRNTTKRELAQLLINPHQYVEAYDVTFNSDFRYAFHNFVLESLAY